MSVKVISVGPLDLLAKILHATAKHGQRVVLEIQSLFNEIKTSPEAIFRYISDSCKFLSASKIQKLLTKHKFGSFSEA